MSIAAQATRRRKAAIVLRTKGVSYTERRAYRQGSGALLGFAGALSKTARKSGAK